MMRGRMLLPAAVLLAAWRLAAQPPAAVFDPASTQLAILLAEDRRAPTPRDVAVIRAAVHSRDPLTARIAIRAIGRLERSALISEILPALRSPLPELRAEAANAIGQAAQGWKRGHPSDSQGPIDGIFEILAARLAVEADVGARAALADTIGRLPYTAPEQIRRAEIALLDALARNGSIPGHLGVVKGLEALIRLHLKTATPGGETLQKLREMAVVPVRDSRAARPRPTERLEPDPAAGARVRRLALQALVTAGATTGDLIARAAADPDPQVRRLAMRAASNPIESAPDVARTGLSDPSAMVRIEALRAIGTTGEDSCEALLAATGDAELRVALVAIDQLASCSSRAHVSAALERMVNDLSEAGAPRGWHRAAHALVSLAAAASDKAAARLPQFVGSSVWQLRMYAARSAALMNQRPALEQLAADANDNVVEAAIDGLSKVAGHGADAVYVSALDRRGYQAIRSAAIALAGSPNADATVSALRATLKRLNGEGRDNSRDARAAIADALRSPAEAPTPGLELRTAAKVTTEALRQLRPARVRIVMRGGGAFDLVLLTAEAPATVVRFAQLAASGYYNGLSFHRVVPNAFVQGGSPGANEYVGDAMFMRDELGLWPHVRGAVGISTRGRDTGDAQIFINLVDNPALDHNFTVFAQVLNGLDVVDGILEGDVMERVEIVLGA